MPPIAHPRANFTLLRALSNTSDDDWLRLNLDHYRYHRALSSSSDGRLSRLMSAVRTWTTRPRRFLDLPGFPDDQLQENIVGMSGEAALREGFAFYLEVTGAAQNLQHPLVESSSVLDFGCGWGRIIRFFLKNVRAENLVGLDVDPSLVTVCTQTNPYCRFILVPSEPPLATENGSVDLIYAFSVFSHLSSDTADRWVGEFARLLKPGGILVITTQPREFIAFCCHWRRHPPQRQWHELLANAFPDPHEAYARYDAGEFLYVPTGGGGVRDASFYGEALIPRQYVQTYWTRHLTLRDFVSDPARCAQALIVMQKGAP